MSRDQALARAHALKAALEKYGVPVSIELQQGVGGSQWYGTAFTAEMSHHTVSRPSMGNTPCLALVKRGRTDVAGPLCNGYGGYDMVYRIITMGWANHPGLGGPTNIGGRTVPKNNGRPYFWGTEYEGGLEQWGPEMHEFMARANRGILDWLNRDVSAHLEHNTWAPGRKIDRLGYTAQIGRERIAAVTGGSWTPPPAPAPANPWAGADPNAVHAPGSRVLRLYRAGTDVKFVQGKIGVEQDGRFGPATVAAFKNWQRANGLVADGSCGPASWAKMLGSAPVIIPATPKPASRPVLKRGSRGASVGSLQVFLKKTGDYTGAVDNSFGPGTDAAVRSYQRRVGLTPDGSVGPATWGAIDAQKGLAGAAAPAPAPSGGGSRTLRRGVSGDDVRRMQTGLNAAFPAYSKLGPDGSFGPATEKVVKEFQRRTGLTPDGSVGPATRAKMAAHGITF